MTTIDITTKAVLTPVAANELLGVKDGVLCRFEIATFTAAIFDTPTFTETVTLPGTTSIGDVSAIELSYVNGVTSSIQAQLNSLATVASQYREANLCTATVGATLASATCANITTGGVSAGLGLGTTTGFMGDSVFYGTRAGYSAKTGNGNVAIGNLSLYTQVDINHVVSIGDACLRFATAVSGGVAMGYVSCTERLTGVGFVTIGSYAGAYSTGGDYGVNIGYYSGAGTEGQTLGNRNLMVGGYSGMQCIGANNIGVGWEVLYSCAGTYNISIGENSGKTLTHANATKNIFIGQDAGTATGVQKVDAINSIAIGYGTYTTASNQVVIGDANITETILRGAVSAGTSITSGFVFTPSNAGSTIGDSSAAALTVGGPGNYQGFYVEKSNAISTQPKFWGWQYRGDTALGNTFGAFVSIGIDAAGTYTIPVMLQGNGDVILTGSTFGAVGKVGIGEAAPDYKLDVNGTFGFTPGASVTPVDNGDVVFQLTSNTQLTIKAKGSDGTVRSGNITLA